MQITPGNASAVQVARALFPCPPPNARDQQRLKLSRLKLGRNDLSHNDRQNRAGNKAAYSLSLPSALREIQNDTARQAEFHGKSWSVLLVPLLHLVLLEY